MGMKVGVVCEGSHDFNVLYHFIDKMVREYGETLDAVECLQPEVSATFQITSGGWTQVKSWCQLGDGQAYRKYFDKPLFSTSKIYDLIVVHLDGDVVEHCDTPPLDSLSIDTLAVPDVISSLHDAILNHWLSPADDHKGRFVPCVPVRHLEAWLSAALGPAVADPEAIAMKDTFRSGPIGSISGSWRVRYIGAAKQAVQKIADIRKSCQSFNRFEQDLRTAIEVA